MKHPLKPTLSVIIPAYNESGNLGKALKGVLSAVDALFSSFEILIVNDGSEDNTGEIAERLSREHRQIRVIHHATNRGLGVAYRTGVEAARYDYIAWVPGDNDVAHDSLRDIFKKVGEADIIIPYMAKKQARPLVRKLLSRTWTAILNLLFGLKIRYFNGLCVYKREILKGIPIETSSFGILAGTLIWALKKGHSHKEVMFHHQGRLCGKSAHFRFKNIFGGIWTIAKLFWRIRVRIKELRYFRK